MPVCNDNKRAPLAKGAKKQLCLLVLSFCDSWLFKHQNCSITNTRVLHYCKGSAQHQNLLCVACQQMLETNDVGCGPEKCFADQTSHATSRPFSRFGGLHNHSQFCLSTCQLAGQDPPGCDSFACMNTFAACAARCRTPCANEVFSAGLEPSASLWPNLGDNDDRVDVTSPETRGVRTGTGTTGRVGLTMRAIVGQSGVIQSKRVRGMRAARLDSGGRTRKCYTAGCERTTLLCCRQRRTFRGSDTDQAAKRVRCRGD